MALIVQKYGGTSVGSVERIQAVAQRVVQAVQTGKSVVVVVSAMGKSTDQLVSLAHQVSSTPCHREMDMLLSTGEQVSIALLSMAIQELGQPAVSLTGAQVGIVTETAHTRARILTIGTDRLQRYLDEGKVVVVAGFQGIAQSDDLEITTLGRGGSDTSAVALAAALNASACEIYTDVPGILTTDPRIVPDAQLMPEITCDEMLELASLGAKVLHPRAVEIARNYGVTLVVRSSWTDDPGTKVISPTPQPRSLEGLELAQAVDAIEVDTHQAKIALLHVPDRPGIAAQLFSNVATKDLDVDLIIQSIHDGNTNDIAFTVNRDCLDRTEAVAEAFGHALPSEPPSLQPLPHTTDQPHVLVERQTAKISIVGAGMIGRPGVAAQMFLALAAANINIQMISTSEVKVSCTIHLEDCDRAVAALCQTFNIAHSPIPAASSSSSTSADTSDRSNRPPVRGAALDLKQARVAIHAIPDCPGMAARIFELLAHHHISVDTIIQSQRCRIVNGTPARDIAFTVAQDDAQTAQALLRSIASDLGCGDITIDEAIAKVSIVGIGMIGCPGVAAKMFAALAAEQINIQMISTSEIKLSCVVSKVDGIPALKTIHDAFNLSKELDRSLPT
ncbi:MAG: aspartate kinase [Leptolyngbyaceae bacterium]|nr:aspartate kinase [Leptolyngbyaceae bacterium]